MFFALNTCVGGQHKTTADLLELDYCQYNPRSPSDAHQPWDKRDVLQELRDEGSYVIGYHLLIPP